MGRGGSSGAKAVQDATGKKETHLYEGRDGDAQFVFHPEDNDLFVRTGQQIISHCRLGISLGLWFEELNDTLAEVAAWASARAAQVRACCCSPKGAKVVFFFAPTGGAFDFDLADDLAKLNDDLLKKFNVGMIELHQVPFAELDRFVDVEGTKVVYGEQPRSSTPMAT